MSTISDGCGMSPLAFLLCSGAVALTNRPIEDALIQGTVSAGGNASKLADSVLRAPLEANLEASLRSTQSSNALEMDAVSMSRASLSNLHALFISALGVCAIGLVGFVMWMCLRRRHRPPVAIWKEPISHERKDGCSEAPQLLGGRSSGATTSSDPPTDAAPMGPEYAWVDVVLSVVAFMAASAGMAIANKMAVSALGLPMLLVGVQCAATLVVLVPLYKTINLGTWRDRMRWLPVSTLFVGMLATSMVAYKLCTLGTVVVIRMVSPLLGLLVELSFDRARFVASGHTFASLAVIMAGVVLYAIFQKGIGGQVMGIVFMMANMFIATAERLAQRYLMAERPVDMSDTGLMFYNNTVCALAMPLMMLAFSEWRQAPARTMAVSSVGWGFVAWSCACGAFISYTAFRAQRRISATSFLVVVNMNKFVVVGYGILALGERYAPLAAVGCAMALCGGAYYSWDRSQLKRRKASREAEKRRLLGESAERESGGLADSDDDEVVQPK